MQVDGLLYDTPSIWQPLQQRKDRVRQIVFLMLCLVTLYEIQGSIVSHTWRIPYHVLAALGNKLQV